MNTTTTLMYVATDGSYGDARDLLLVDASGWTANDYEALEAVDDGNRVEEAVEIVTYRSDDSLVWAWLTTDEAFQITMTIDAAIATAMSVGQMGLAEQLGDVRDVLRRSGIKFD